jgi:hypothetical protein
VNRSSKLSLMLVPLALVAACGGGDDLDDRLDVADPAVRFVHAAPAAPAVTLLRGDREQTDARDVSYGFASNYFDVDSSQATWSIETSTGSVEIDSVDIDPSRGNKYTILAVSDPDPGDTLFVIRDPYRKSLDSDDARLRVANASINVDEIDVYLNAPGTDISPTSVTPLLGGIDYRSAGPGSGSDSEELEAGDYQLTITAAGSKTVLFQGELSLGEDDDVLLVTTPDSIVSDAIDVLIKVEGSSSAGEVAPL